MKRLSSILLVLACGLALLGAAPAPSSETLLEEGNRAMQERNFTRAIELYEQAELLAAEPGLVTFNLALAKYQRGIKDNSATDLYQAEQLYGYLLDDSNPRRAIALLGLGNCRLQRAGEHDARTARLAIEAYEQCLQATKDETLLADVQYNLERAHLLLQQIQTAEDDKKPPESEPNNGNNSKPPNPQTNPNQDKNNTGDGQKPVGPPEPVKATDGDKPIPTNSPPAPGRGDLRPVPDQPDLPPLTAEEAREHLKQANDRIWRERRQHRLGLAKPPAEGVRDW